MTAKYSVGQVVIFKREGKTGLPCRILEVIEDEEGIFYRIDRKNCLSETMIRALDETERGPV